MGRETLGLRERSRRMTSLPFDDQPLNDWSRRSALPMRQGSLALRWGHLARGVAVPIILAGLTIPDAELHAKRFKLGMIVGNVMHRYTGL